VGAALKVLILGGHGFIGRHAAKHLAIAGADVTVGTRNPRADSQFRQARYRLEERQSSADWAQDVEQYDVILNCVGILRQRRGESYEAIHHLAPQALAQACHAAQKRFVHVSALGLSADCKSRFLTSKYHGERAIMASQGDWIIARPSLLEGDGGFGAEWLRAIAQLPVFVVPASARGNIAALTVDDAGVALARLCMGNASEIGLDHSRIYELGGAKALSFEHYIRALRSRYSDKNAVCLSVPGWIARAAAHLFDVIHFSPFSFGHWELLCKDNVPDENRLPSLLQHQAEDPVLAYAADKSA